MKKCRGLCRGGVHLVNVTFLDLDLDLDFPEKAAYAVLSLWSEVLWSCVFLLCCSCRTHGMDGAHKRQQRTADLVVGDKDEAGAKRRRVQNGVATSGRKGQATQIPAEVQKEVAKAMRAGSALVQASLEQLQSAERSWDNWLADGGARRSGRQVPHGRARAVVHVADVALSLACVSRAARRPEKQRAQLCGRDGQQFVADEVSGVCEARAAGAEGVLE